MWHIEAKLQQELKEAGKQLFYPSHIDESIDELLLLLDQIQKLLSEVDESPGESMLEALEPSRKGLIQVSLLRHSDIDVKVSVAACLSEITRITAPDVPYSDDQMRDIFQLIVSSFQDSADQSSYSYMKRASKRASMLYTVSKHKLCVIMLDLECDALIVEMFEHFLRSVSDYPHKSVYPSMESLMVLVLEESDRISAEMLKPLLANVKKDNEGVLPVARKLAEGVLMKSADKLKPYLMPAIVSLGDTLDKYTKVVASVCEGKTATVEHNNEIASGVQQATKCKLVKESKYKAHQADESILTTTSSDHTGQVFKKGACLKEVDSTLDRSLKSVMINGVDGTGNQEASHDLETSKKSEKEVTNQESLDKKDTEGSILDRESKPEDQASKKRGKEDDTVINSTESMVGLAYKRASRETSDGSAKKIRVCRVVGDSCLAPPPVTCSDATVEGRESDRTASGHLPLGDKDVMRNPSHQMFLPGASIPTTEERVRKMGRSGVVDRLQGMANESAALFSHAAESTHALELDNSELERQLNEFILRDKGYHEKISVLQREVSDLKSLGEQMKLNLEARAVDAERRALEAETKLVVAKRIMAEAEGTMKAALASFAL